MIGKWSEWQDLNLRPPVGVPGPPIAGMNVDVYFGSND